MKKQTQLKAHIWIKLPTIYKKKKRKLNSMNTYQINPQILSDVCFRKIKEINVRILKNTVIPHKLPTRSVIETEFVLFLWGWKIVEEIKESFTCRADESSERRGSTETITLATWGESEEEDEAAAWDCHDLETTKGHFINHTDLSHFVVSTVILLLLFPWSSSIFVGCFDRFWFWSPPITTVPMSEFLKEDSSGLILETARGGYKTSVHKNSNRGTRGNS